MVNACVMNQSRGHWLLSNALFITITMTCKFKEEDEMNLFVDGLMEKDVIIGVGVGFVSFQHKERNVWFFGC
jgi:hypothetical protein